MKNTRTHIKMSKTHKETDSKDDYQLFISSFNSGWDSLPFLSSFIFNHLNTTKKKLECINSWGIKRV